MTLNSESSAESDQAAIARLVLKLIDLTSLGESDTEREVASLCQQARSATGPVASVCIWPQFVGSAVKQLDGSGISVCAVANFPDGQNDPELAVSDALRIVESGGVEIDVVIPWRSIRDGERGVARRLVASVREAVGSGPIIKAILETGELSDPEIIRVAGTEAIAGGADYLKTSTGKTVRSATPEAAEVLLGLIRDHKSSTGQTVGLKISGGVRSVAQAREYLDIAEVMMGPGWVSPATFRFGASSLLEDVANVLKPLDS